MRFVLASLLLGALLLGMALPERAGAQAAAQPTVRAVDVTGFQNLSPQQQQTVRDMAATLVGKPYDQAATDAVKGQMEDLGLFVYVSVTQEQMADGVKLVFSVIENPVVTAVRFTGNVTFTEAQLRKIGNVEQNIPLGQVLQQNNVRAVLEAINNAYGTAGYVWSEAIPPAIDRQTGTLTFTIIEPRISEIRINVTGRTHDYVITRQLEFKVGDVYNARKIAASLNNLNQLGIFDSVNILPEPGINVGSIRVSVTVVERRTGTAGFGIAQSSGQGWTGFVNVADTNLFGTGQYLSLNVRFGGEDSYMVSYSNPWIDHHRTSVTTSIYNQSIQREGFSDQSNNTFPYVEDRTGGTVTFGRPIDALRTTRVFLGFRVDTISAHENDPGDIPTNIAPFITQKSDVRSVSLSAVRDTRYPNLFAPIRGSYATLGTEAAGFGGSNFTKLTGDVRRYITVRTGKTNPTTEREGARNWVYATRLMAGTSTGIPPFLDQYTVGGPDSLRGYDVDRFPGQNMVLFSNELRVPINDSFGVVAFVDAGDAWGGRFAEQLGDKDFTFHYDYGAGLRVLLPALGPIRLDYAFNDRGGTNIAFGVAQSF